MKRLEEALGTAMLNLGNLVVGAIVVGFVFEKKAALPEALSVLILAIVCYVGGIVVFQSGGKS